MKKAISTLLILVLIVPAAIAQSNINIDEKAPAINITDWVLNKPDDITLSGKYIVLEFWATWCGPCIAAVPHMNELQSNVNDPDLMFISMTDESVEKIKRTVKKIDFKSAVVTDLTKQTQVGFGDGKKGLEAYPMTVLIDNKGIVKWVGEPKQLSEDILNKFVSSELKGVNHLKKGDKEVIPTPVSNIEKSTEESPQTTFLKHFKDKNSVIYFELKKTESSNTSSMKFGDNAMVLSPVSLRELYQEVFNVQVASSSLTDSTKYSLIYKNAKPNGNSLAELENLILSSLNLTHQTNLEKVSKYIISVENLSLLTPALDTRFSAKSDAEDKMIFSNYTIAAMIDDMEKTLNANLEFKGLNEIKYDFIMNSTSLESFRSSLESYGLSMEEHTSQEEVIYLVEKK